MEKEEIIPIAKCYLEKYHLDGKEDHNTSVETVKLGKALESSKILRLRFITL